jgi:hypothetical protein
MMKKCLLTIAFAFVTIAASFSQERYLDEVFTGVTKNTVIYGQNFHILFVPVTGHSALQPLVADIYTPTGDTEVQRPLILMFHSGNFLPFPQNQSVNGTRSDSSIVLLSRRLAKMGYVVASIDYRLGWNPVAPEQDTRVNTLINAAYRGVQDARTAIRYFKSNAGNFGVDTSKVILWGVGTGGYITLNTGALDRYAEVVTTTNPESKFIGNNGFPMVIEQINGNIWGTSLGKNPLNGDTLCLPNNLGPSSDFQLIVNMGGALGDISWLDEKTPPVISYQTTTDPFAPYKDDVLIVPGPNLPVVQVQGAYEVQKKAKALGINAKFADKTFIDPLSQYVSSVNDGYEGLYPIFKANVYDSAPWDYWDRATNANDATGIQTNPDMSLEKATLYMDTIVTYFAPRACLVLDLGCDLKDYVSSTKVISQEAAGLTASPNPSADYVMIQSESKMIKGIVLFDATGRTIKVIPSINNKQFRLERNNMPTGVYYAQVQFENATATVKLSFIK